VAKGGGRKIRKTVSRSRRDHEVVSFPMLHDTPHRLNIFRRPSPVSLDREVAEPKGLLTARSDAAGRANDLFGDKPFRPERRFVVKQDSVSSKQAVGIAIVGHRPMCRRLSDGIGAAWMKWR